MSAVTDGGVLDALVATGVDVRAAGEADTVDGVPAAFVARPADTGQTAAVLRAAADAGLAVVARGTGTKLDWGLPPERVDLLLDTSGMDRLLDHAAGDLVVHVQAGIRLDVLQETLRTAKQRLALDPLVGPAAGGPGTVGGTLATGSDGPLRHSHGAARDLVIGMTMVRADGVVARSGGRVVKNVAGYDLGKLLTGSWGTLGVVTEAIFRLHPLPLTARWLSVTGPDAPQRALAAVRSQAVPAAVELDRRAGADPTVAVLVDGFPDGVAARAETLRALLGDDVRITDTPPAWWGRPPWEPEGTALRLTATLTGVGELLAALADLPLPADVRGSAGFGKLFAGLAAGAEPALVAQCVETLRAQRDRWGGDVVVLRAPARVREAVDAWGPVSGLEIMRRIKHEFDPSRRLAPGRFVGGI